ncbi:Translationally-controlled tumor [Liparis tanakae]|uniref:Translationally-controlled tumor protein homolog n=1 Tax=Liparis tanakae TaxID=230148 RepID=A0A4Z2IQA7_9TELE|nr:Translationally-controlled tumor [Liparis tanakae]
MIIYRCIISNDEMFSDSFKMKESENGIFYEVEGKLVTRSEGFDDSLIGANASAEEAADGADASSVSGVDIVLNHSLRETGFTKKLYLPYFKKYVKAVRDNLEKTNPERVATFMEEVQKEAKKIVNNITNYQFYMGENMHPEGMMALLDYREDGITPFMLFFKDGLIVEKC